MESLQYEIIKKQCGTTYLYLIEDSQLFTVKSGAENNVIYRCKNRSCNNIVQVIDGFCKRRKHNPHHEKDGGESEYVNLKLEVTLKDKLIQNLNFHKGITEILRENNMPNNSIWHSKLYRLKMKLTQKSGKKRCSSKIITKSIDKLQTVHAFDGDPNKANSEWTCSIITNQTSQNKNTFNALQNELISTNNVLQRAWSALNPTISYENFSENSSESSTSSINSTNEITQNMTHNLLVSDTNSINSQINFNIIQNSNINKSPTVEPHLTNSVNIARNSSQTSRRIEIEAIFFKKYKKIDNCKF